MDPQFWHQRWQENRIGFHQTNVNSFLQRHFEQLAPRSDGRVFVPLCGKSHDMSWIRAQGPEVLGCELSSLAVDAYYQETHQVAERVDCGPFLLYSAGGVAVLVGDFFQLTPVQVGYISAVYDRAALISLPAKMRVLYAQHMAHLLTAGTPMLLVAPFAPERLADGPPFAVSTEEVQQLYGEFFSVEVLERYCNTAVGNTHLAARGIVWREEVVYFLVRR